MAPKIHVLQEQERLEPDFWEDYKWALEHYGELREKYADMWVAIADKKVVAFGEDLTDEREVSISRELNRPPVTLFVEGMARILYNKNAYIEEVKEVEDDNIKIL